MPQPQNRLRLAAVGTLLLLLAACQQTVAPESQSDSDVTVISEAGELKETAVEDETAVETAKPAEQPIETPTDIPTTAPTATAESTPTDEPEPPPTTDPALAAKYADYQLITLLPRDAIPAIDDPQFLSIEEADEFYDPTELVIGVEFNGDARAYSVPLLSNHEIVNDTVGGVKIAVTW